MFIFHNIYMKKEEESRERQIKLCQQPKCLNQLWERHVYSWDLLQHIPLFSRPYKAVNMKTDNTVTEEKLLAVFDSMKKLKTWFDFWLKKKNVSASFLVSEICDLW